MALTRILTTVATCFLVFDTVLAAADAANSSQYVVPNAAGATALDPAKVQKYKSLLDHFDWKEKWENGFKWHDIVDDYAPANADCSPRCLTCAPGCNPRCCALDTSPATTDRNFGSPDTFISRPIFPEPGPGEGAIRSERAHLVDDDIQKNLLDRIFPIQEHFWGRPKHPEACPCYCAPTCPAYIQAICCTTPGSDSRVSAPPKKLHDVLAMVTATTSGDPVSVLAAINLTVFDSFITMNLVRGLKRVNEVTYSDDTKTFEITLGVTVGPKETKQALAHTFVVVDGSRLLEEEQILLGAGFMNRIGVRDGARVGAVNVNKDFLTPLEEGLPVLTGVDESEKEK
ncbi:hypothetical protein AYO20_10116 [Fonsecaea nubica]|uniref:Uncharacterized protein n=1 Tax=Fonsecaea nubica TaxID=856822 RepID=A0A178C901_9EURO|nr:hypothetical protein AYO20_10116 [Fonsecaea nubica]OAL26448.1 hypothetical protein AYO20_10116 [Fonsecaea nubica]